MRRTAAEKYELIRLVEGSELPVRQTLRELRLTRSTFYRWYHRYLQHGRTGLDPRPAAARRYWNRIPLPVRPRVVDAALADPERSPRELAWRLTDQEGHFLSESSVYRILKAYDLIPSPAFIVLTAAKSFRHPTRRPNELWQTDFTYLQVASTADREDIRRPRPSRTGPPTGHGHDPPAHRPDGPREPRVGRHPYSGCQTALGNLGHQVARGTIANVRKERGLEPAPARTTRTTWREFLAAHWDGLSAADCFTVEVWTPRGLTRFTVLVLMHLASRLQIAGISAEPDGPGVTQLMRNAPDAEDGCLRHIRFLIHDRDPLFRPAVRDPLPPADVTPIRRPRPRAEPERLHGALRAHHQGLLPRAHGPDRRGLAASRRPRVRRALPPRTESPGARQSPDPAAVDGTATPWSRPVPPAARWDVALLLSVSSVIHDRPSTPRSRFGTVRAQASSVNAYAAITPSSGMWAFRLEHG